MKIYLDVCCLNRPFDNQAQNRVHLEAEAVISILERCQKSAWRLVSSEVIDLEVLKIPDPDRKNKVTLLTLSHRDYVIINKNIVQRASELESFGVFSYDALHIACAEHGKADVFLTTDDALLKKIKQIKIDIKLKLKVENPLRWLMEVI
jgi:predicted nucleic acid-binding protein